MASRPFIDIPFQEYAPDWGGLPRAESPGYLTDCINLRRTPNGYRGTPTFSDVASATAIGSVSETNALGAAFPQGASTYFYWIGSSAQKMYESRAEGTDTWLDVSPAALAGNGDGDFVRFGYDIIYVSGFRAPIYKDITTSQATLFANLPGSPPISGCAARVRQHVVLGNGAGGNFYTLRTSAIGDAHTWPTIGTSTALAQEAIQQDMPQEFGGILRLLGGEKFGIVMQERALTRMTYVGGSVVYEFDTYETKNGVGGYGTFYSRPITDGKLWYWYNENGLFVTDGYSTQNLASGSVEESLFLNTLSHPNGTSLQPAFTSAYDAKRKLLIFGGNAYAGATTYQLVYSLSSNSFSLIQETNRLSFFSAIRYSSTTNLTGTLVYNVNGSNRKLQRLNANSTPTIALQTGYIEIDPGYTVQFQGAHLLGTGTSGLTLSYKTASTSSACDVSQSGFTSLTAAGRGQKQIGRPGNVQYIAFRVTGTGAESQLIHGIRIYFERAEPAS